MIAGPLAGQKRDEAGREGMSEKLSQWGERTRMIQIAPMEKANQAAP
jgi:hypothetical protein